MGRRKAGMCKCGHELRRFHDDAGICTYGAGTLFAGGCEREHGGPCAKPRKKKAMNGTTKTVTRPVTVDGARVLHSLRLIRGSFMTIADELGTLIAEIEQSNKTSGPLASPRGVVMGLFTEAHPTIEKQTAAQTTRDREDVATPSRRAEVPKSAAPVRGDEEITAGAQVVLEAIAQWGGSADSAELAIATGYAPRTVSDYLSELSSAGRVTRSAGRATLTAPVLAGPKPTQEQLRARTLQALSAGQAEVLQALFDAGGQATTGEIAEATEFAPRTVSDYLSELSSRRLLTRADGIATLHRELGGPSS